MSCEICKKPCDGPEVIDVGDFWVVRKRLAYHVDCIIEEWEKYKSTPVLSSAEIAKQIREWVNKLSNYSFSRYPDIDNTDPKFQHGAFAVAQDMRAFADRLETEGKLAAIESVAGMLTAGEAAMIEAEPTTSTLAESRLPYEGVFPQPEIERGRGKGPDVPAADGIVSRDNPRLRDLLTPNYATYLLDRICDGQSSPPWSDCMNGGCDQCDGPGMENCHPFCDALQKLAEKGK